jgi:CDP-diacylglycerol---glycerol-3-phosphate 3-phosphatidyltransferase
MIKRSTIPNLITVGRIALTPVVAYLIFVPTFTARFIGWILFLIAAFSDLIDGHLARKHGWISDFGKLVDPIADKGLLVATMLPFYILSNRPGYDGALPFIDSLPLWIIIVVFGRELLITLIRAYAAKKGIVIPAGKVGKHKAVWQNIFIGTTILWYALRSAAVYNDWHGSFWIFWQKLHGTVFLITLVVAVVLTVYSLVIYLWSWRKLTTAL